MFVLPERENPLSQLLTGLGQTGLAYAGNKLQQSREQKQRDALSGALGDLETQEAEGRDVSPLTALKTIMGVNAPEAMKKQALDAYEKMSIKRKSAPTPLNPDQQEFINSFVGPSVGSMWPDLTPGEKLEYIRGSREAMDRYGMTLEEMISQKRKKNPEITPQDVVDDLIKEDEESLESKIWENYNKKKQTEESMGGEEPLVNKPLDIDFSVLPKQLSDTQRGAPRGLTDKERSSIWYKHNQDKNSAAFKEATESLRSGESLLSNLGKMKAINEKGTLPSGIKKALFVDSEGNLRPISKLTGLGFSEEELTDIGAWETFLSSAALSNLKESFGGRITDFDIKSQAKKFPSLLNTQEGRHLLLNHIMLAERANMLHSKAKRELISRYNAGEISPESVDMLAEKLIAPQLEEIRQESSRLISASEKLEREEKETKEEKPGVSLKSAGVSVEFKDLPSPSDPKYVGRKFRDKKTGKIFVSNGETFEEKK